MLRLSRSPCCSTVVSRALRGSLFSTASHRGSSTGGYSLSSSNGLHPDDLSMMVFGSSTDVGKTIISAGLCLSALRHKRKVCYIKPVQTGELDEYFIQFYTNPRGINDIFVRTLQHWQVEMAPPLAAKYDTTESQAMSDDDLLNSLQREMMAFVDSARSLENSKAAANSNTSPTNSQNIDTNTKKATKQLCTVVETFGGVLSPGPNTTLQADMYRALRLPVILVGDSRYGGISSTLSAYESLRLRGYNIYAIVLIDRAEAGAPDNASLIQEQIKHTYHGSSIGRAGGPLRVFTLSPMPSSQKTLLHSWFQQNESGFDELLDHIIQNEELEYQGYNRMVEASQRYLWWSRAAADKHPAAGAGGNNENKPKNKVDFVESAYGDHYRFFSMESEVTANSERPLLTTMFDATANVHCQSVGHGNPHMSLVMAEACGKFGNILPFESHGIVHPPLVQLADHLIAAGPGKDWAKRAYFAEDTMDALQEAVQMAVNMVGTGSGKDGAVLVTNPAHQHVVRSSQMQAVQVNMPTVAFVRGKLAIRTSPIFNTGTSPTPTNDWREAARAEQANISTLSQLFEVDSRLTSTTSKLNQFYQAEIESVLHQLQQQKDVKALLLEPVMISTEEMKFVDPLYQKMLVQACKQRGIPIIYDEINTGIYRLGPASAWSLLKEKPDLACYGKALAGGYSPLSIVLSTEEVYQANADRPLKTGTDGFASNPIACSAALENFRLMERSSNYDRTKGVVRDAFNEEDVKNLSKLPGITSTIALGQVFSVQLTPLPSNTTNEANPPKKTGLADAPVIGTAPVEPDNNLVPIVGQDASNSGTSYATLMTSLLRKERVFATVSAEGHSMYLLANPLSTDYDKQRLLRVTRRCVTKAYYMRPQPVTTPPPFPTSAN